MSVFRETTSGAKTELAQLRRVLGEFDAGDVLMETRLDCSTRNLTNIFATIVDRKAGFRSLAAIAHEGSGEAVRKIARCYNVGLATTSRLET